MGEPLLIMPLYFTLGSSISNLQVTGCKVVTGAAVTAAVFSLAAAALYFLMPALVRLMGQDEALFEETVSYVRIEIFGFIFLSVNSFLLIPVKLLLLNRAVLASLVLKLVLAVVLDLAFLSSLPFSLQLGVRGVAYSNIATEASTTLLLATSLRGHWAGPWSLAWLRDWFRVGFYSGLDSLIRNLVYMLVILRSMNLLSSAGLYFTTNSFIWSYLLLPFLPLSEILRVDIASAGKPWWSGQTDIALLFLQMEPR